MQPRELVIQGLTSFTDRVTLDFSDVSLFGLVGPTGAGKSSIVDAITLALYGRIPRLKQSEIAPAISTTASECTVGLTFTVRGTPHRAVRTIRRTKTGASTPEAALERLDDDGNVLTVLAGTADDVTVEVERLIGLTFAEFTRAVVLPQGEFARVLRATPSDRQNLLSRLLGVGIYDRVKTRAGAHARSAGDRAEQIATQILQLGASSTSTVDELAASIATLDQLVERLDVDQAALDAIRDDYRDASDRLSAAEKVADSLRGISTPPPAVRDHGDAVEQADRALQKASEARDAISAKLDEAMASAPTADELDALTAAITAHQATEGREVAVLDAKAALADLTREREQLAADVTAAEARVAAAEQAQAAAHREHAAVQAAQGLAAGDDCPVCAATLTAEAPGLNAPADAAGVLDEVAEEFRRATGQQGQLQARQQRLVADVQKAEQALADATQAKADHDAALVGLPTLAEATARRDTARQLDTQLKALRTEATAASTDVQQATRARAQLDDRAKQFNAMFDEMRLTVAALGPPALEGEVGTDWAALHAWAQAALPDATAEVEEARSAVAAVTERGQALRAQMNEACAAAGVPESGGGRAEAQPRDRAIQHRADLQAEKTRVAQMAEMIEQLGKDEEDAREQQVIGAELAKLLRTDRFQRWLLDEATRALVIGASARLGKLSSGRYELGMQSNGQIHVRDLANAGAERNVRTLSGGETFLASLALALSLAEQIAMSASGPVALESLFIDEGFGALDPETLDIAAGAIEQLGTGDRTVGVITHVAELAERLPTRFVVERTSGGSRVGRVDL